MDLKRLVFKKNLRRHHWCWLLLLGLVAIFWYLVWIEHQLDVRLIVVGGLALALGLWTSGFRVQGLCACLLVLPLLWHLWWWHNQAEHLLERVALDKEWLWVKGVVRGIERINEETSAEKDLIKNERGASQAQVLLGQVYLNVRGEKERRAVELRLILPLDIRQHWRVRKGLPLLLGLQGLKVQADWGRLTVRATQAVWRPLPAKLGWGLSMQRRLSLRAGYYLNAGAHAVYRPVLLGLRGVHTPEGREVVRGFREAGVAHLLAISGLHIGLFFGVFWLGLGWLRQRWSVWREAESGRIWQRWLAMGLVWVQIFMIGGPAPAVRAGVMGSLLIASGLVGLRIARLHLLAISALLLLLWDASAIYTLSFQMSFLAYFFLTLGLAWFPWVKQEQSSKEVWLQLVKNSTRLISFNLWVSAFIVLGLWPLTSYVFGRISLLSFAGNLLVAPLLGLIVLPVGLTAMLLSLFHMLLRVPVGGWLEWTIFKLLQVILDAWLLLIQFLRQKGSFFVFEHQLGWSLPSLLGFYMLILAIVVAWSKWQQWQIMATTGSCSQGKCHGAN